MGEFRHILGFAPHGFCALHSGCVSNTFLSSPLGDCFTYLFVPSPRDVLHIPFCPLPSGCASHTFFSPPLGVCFRLDMVPHLLFTVDKSCF